MTHPWLHLETLLPGARHEPAHELAPPRQGNKVVEQDKNALHGLEKIGKVSQDARVGQNTQHVGLTTLISSSILDTLCGTFFFPSVTPVHCLRTSHGSVQAFSWTYQNAHTNTDARYFSCFDDQWHAYCSTWRVCGQTGAELTTETLQKQGKSAPSGKEAW